MDDDQPATAETIIHALSQFGNVEQDQDHHQDHHHHANDYDNLLPENVTEELELEQEDELGGLGGMSRGELEAEVLKLRGMVYDTRTPTSSTMTSSHSKQGPALGSGSEESRMVKRRRLDSKEIDITVGRDLQTGKRVEKGRRTELGKAIRCHVGHVSISTLCYYPVLLLSFPLRYDLSYLFQHPNVDVCTADTTSTNP
jgi:hypothetical protein